MTRFAALVLALAWSTTSSAQDNPLARYRTLSAPDCVTPANFVSQSASSPVNQTYMRVQHIGDAGTIEQDQQLANAVTWDLSELTGLATPREAQRGFRDVGPPLSASAFQLWCGGAGFLMNSWQFAHRAPLFGEGPSVSIARDFDPPRPLFANGAGILLEADVSLPVAHFETPPAGDGTAQVSFMYYVVDSTTGTPLAHLVGLYENRLPGPNGSAGEAVLSDGVIAFVVSPLRALDYAGRPVRFVKAMPGSETMQFVQPWREARRFRALVTADAFRALLQRLKAESLPRISTEPSDYRLGYFGVLAEIFPGTGDAHNVMIGGSVTGLALSEVPPQAFSRRGSR